VTKPNSPNPIDCQDSDHPSASEELTHDLELATATDLPVLISGSPSASRAIACELDRKSRTPRGSVEIVDCRDGGAVSTLQGLTRADVAEPDRRDRSRILLLQEVHALGPNDQAVLEREIEAMQTRPTRPVRILASSSAPLFERVVDHLFSERLFYRLNLIHVVVPPEYGATDESGRSAGA
jgi:hypothetical protein